MNTTTETKRCPCGWGHDGLNAAIVERQSVIERYTTGDCSLHPFRVAGLAGERKAIETLEWHLAGGCESKGYPKRAEVAQPAPELAAQPDPEHYTRIEAQRVTLQFGRQVQPSAG
jgi:hypothetical protein